MPYIIHLLFILPVFLALPMTIGCDVKSRVVAEAGSPVVSPAQGDLPNILPSAAKSFYVHIDKLEFPNEQYVTREFRLARTDLSPIEGGVEFAYGMPEMPEMPVEAIKVEQISPGRYRVTYFISMSGLWEFRVQVTPKDGTPDSLAIRFTVPE